MWAIGRVNPTSHLHQIQRSRLLSRCTQQQFAGTGWWPHHCPPRHASLAPAALQPFAVESLGGWQKAGHYEHHSQQATKTWAWRHQKQVVVVEQQVGHQHHQREEVGVLEGEGEAEERLQMVGTREVVALGSQLLVEGEVVEEQQSQGGEGKREARVVEGSQETRILQMAVEAARSLEVEVEGQVEGQSQVWDLAGSSEEELGVDGLG